MRLRDLHARLLVVEKVGDSFMGRPVDSVAADMVEHSLGSEDPDDIVRVVGRLLG